MFKAIKAYAGQCVSADTQVVVDEYLNQDDNGELAVSLINDGKIINLYRTVKGDRSVKYTLIEIDKTNKTLARYGVKKQAKTSVSEAQLECVSSLFDIAKDFYQ